MEIVEATTPPVPATLLDHVEARILEAGGAVQHAGEVLDFIPVTHRFTPGLYVREIFMPKGTVLTSRTHKTEHPFVISKGKLRCFDERGGWQQLEAPHTGITKPGTRRLLFIESDTIWTTFHPTNTTDLLELDAELLEPHENPLLGGH